MESLSARCRNEIAECKSEIAGYKSEIQDYKNKAGTLERKAFTHKRVITILHKRLSDKKDSKLWPPVESGRTPLVITDGDQERPTSDAERSMFDRGFEEGRSKESAVKDTRRFWWNMVGLTGIWVLVFLVYGEGYKDAMQEIAKKHGDSSIEDTASRALESYSLFNEKRIQTDNDGASWRRLLWKK